MSKHEDQFFNMFRDSLKDFSPEVPETVYSGIRKKMRRQGFFTFSMGSLNIWYVAVAAGLVTAVAVSNISNETTSMAIKTMDQVDETITKPNNHLLLTNDEGDIQEDALAIQSSKESNKVLVSQKKKTNPINTGSDMGSIGSEKKSSGEDKLAMNIDKKIKGNEVITPMEVTPVIEAKDLTSNIFFFHEIGGMKYNLKQEIEKDDIIKIQVPIPSKK